MSNSTYFRSTPIDRSSFIKLSARLISSFSPATDSAALVYIDDQARELIDQLHTVNLEGNMLISNPDKIEKELRDSLQKRLFLMKAMQKTEQDWAYRPEKP